MLKIIVLLLQWLIVMRYVPADMQLTRFISTILMFLGLFMILMVIQGIAVGRVVKNIKKEWEDD